MSSFAGLRIVTIIRVERVRESLAHTCTFTVVVGWDSFSKSITHLKLTVSDVVHVCLFLVQRSVSEGVFGGRRLVIIISDSVKQLRLVEGISETIS